VGISRREGQFLISVKGKEHQNVHNAAVKFPELFYSVI
jgi:hypothetical protein